MAKSTVYFTKEITPEARVKDVPPAGRGTAGKVAVKSTAARMATRTSCVPSS